MTSEAPEMVPTSVIPPRGEPVTAQQALWRGFRSRCPNCGEGKMFRAFLKVADNCPTCGEELLHHRADDFPAYIVIIVVGHILVPIVLAVETEYAPPMWVHWVTWLPLILVSCIGLLQPVKGAVVGLQWFLGMHGFDKARARRLGLPEPEPSVLAAG